MVGFLQKLFGNKAEPPPVTPPPRRPPTPATPAASAPRRLNHPRDLQVNDELRLAECDLVALSGKRFQVTSVSTYLFAKPVATFALQGEDGMRYFLSLCREEQGDYVTFIKPLPHRDVGRLFRLEDLASLFEEKEGPFTLVRQEALDHLTGWTAEEYVLVVDALQGYFFKEDLRGKAQISSQGGEGLDHYLLIDEQERFILEVEVYDDGEPEVALGVRLPLHLIAELRPGLSG